MSEPLKPYLNSRVKRWEEETEEDEPDATVCFSSFFSCFVSCFDWEDEEWEIDEDWDEELEWVMFPPPPPPPPEVVELEDWEKEEELPPMEDDEDWTEEELEDELEEDEEMTLAR